MTKADLVDQIATATGLTRVETDAVVDGVITLVAASLVRGERVELRGLGVFDVVERAARLGRNPSTGQAVPVPARRAVAFRPSQGLRDAVEDAG